jgi:hypothetical protein
MLEHTIGVRLQLFRDQRENKNDKEGMLTEGRRRVGGSIAEDAPHHETNDEY